MAQHRAEQQASTTQSVGSARAGDPQIVSTSDTRTGRFGRGRSNVERVRPVRVRGGLSLGGILTGAVVSLGAMVLLDALIAGIAAETGAHLLAGGKVTGSQLDTSVAAGIAAVIAALLAYLWGGYAAGRMARGLGAVNGILVPIVATLLLFIAGVVAAGMGAGSAIPTGRLSISGALVHVGFITGIAIAVAMLLGGLIGGMRGSRWHTRLENQAAVAASRGA